MLERERERGRDRESVEKGGIVDARKIQRKKGGGNREERVLERDK